MGFPGSSRQQASSHPSSSGVRIDPTTDEDQEEQDSRGILETLRIQLISVRTMRRPLQVVTVLVFIQLGLVAVLLATHGLPQPQVQAGITGNFSSAHLPLAAMVVITLSLGLGWCFILTGAQQVHWGLRLPVIALVTIALGFFPVFQLTSDSGLEGSPYAQEADLAWVQLGILSLVWAWSTGVLLAERRHPRYALRSADKDPFPTGRFALVSTLMLLYEAAVLADWLAYRQAGLQVGAGIFTEALTGQLFAFPLLLAVVIFWSSTDLIDWGELGGRALIKLAQKVQGERLVGARPWPLLIVTGVAATGIIGDVLRVYGASALLGLYIATMLMPLVVLFAYLAKIDSGSLEHVPAATRVAGVVFMFAEFPLIYPLGYAIAGWWGVPVNTVGPAIGVMLGLLVDVVGVTIGLILLARGRLLRRPATSATGLFLLMACLLVIVLNWHLVLTTLGLPDINLPLHLLAGIRLLAALCVLGLVVWLSMQSRPPAAPRRLLASALLLLAGLQVVDWSFDLVEAQTAVGRLSAVAFAGVFLVAVLWDVLTSGEGITNGHSRAFPRNGRVLLYLGYTLIAGSVLLYAASIQIPVTGALSADIFSTDTDAALGLLILGLPLIGLNLAQRLCAWMALQRPMRPMRVSSAETLVTSPLARGIQAIILGCGSAVVVAVLALTALRVVPLADGQQRPAPSTVTPPGPRSTTAPTPSNPPATQTPYRAQAPGPGCDPGGARWSMVPMGAPAICEPAGLTVSLDPGTSVVLQFVPPTQVIASSYQVSAQVNMSSLPSGCTGIITQASEQGFYEDDICTDGSWFAFVNLGSAQVIGQGTTSAASSVFTLGVQVRDNTPTLFFNGAALPTPTSGTVALVSSDFLGISLNNLANTAGTITISDFVYQPLSKTSGRASLPAG
jgi:hypothetical protein